MLRGAIKDLMVYYKREDLMHSSMKRTAKTIVGESHFELCTYVEHELAQEYQDGTSQGVNSVEGELGVAGLLRNKLKRTAR